MSQIGNLNKIRQDVITVVAQQRVAIEQNCRNATDQHHIVGKSTDQAGLDIQPDEQRQGCQQQLNHHPHGSYCDSLLFVGKRGGGGGIDVGEGGQGEQDNPHLMHLAPPLFHRKGMAELVEDFHQGVDQPEQQQITRRKELVGQTAGQFGPVQTCNNYGGKNN